ncbi:MAG: hypothetical protein SGI88_06760, partial [Candidatus Hydrogenedentes bacterium]|nr:hypothetical protein [Candidatus Hydrogenedentota bacterium]
MLGTHFVRGVFAILAALIVGLGGAPEALAQPVCPEDGTATFAVEDRVLDANGLLPLYDWVPAFAFTLQASETTTPRQLRDFGFLLIDDPAEERPYDRRFDLRPSDILEIAIFREGGLIEDWGTLDELDFIVQGRAGTGVAGVPLVIDPTGSLIFQPGTDINVAPPNEDLRYDLRLQDFEITSNGPEFQQTYIVAVRTSKNWRNMLTLSFLWVAGRSFMITTDGRIPTLADCELAEDNYPDESISGGAYSASFGAWDVSSGPDLALDLEYANAWAHPRSVYTPLEEYHRPRFDVGGAAFDFVAGEYVELRQLISLDNWKSLIGINAHGAPTVSTSGFFTEPKDAILKEVNVILTDIGADPFGAPGNGGFNPVQGLETHVDGGFLLDENVNTAINRDFGFNGLWVFYDTNNNGAFDQPVPLGGIGGVDFSGLDHPMFPEGISFNGLPENPDDRNPGLPRWEYVPFPPGGGDPWWKIRLRLSDFGRRRNLETDEEPFGWLEATPDGGEFSSFQSDYFVVVRPDSGYQDTQALPGDGVGLTFGADFRAFIEPRRANPNSIGPGGFPQQDGGVFVKSQRAEDSFILEGQYITSAWQEDPLWFSEPWWPERTLNKTNAKPVRSTVEIHDLVINYESNNLFAKVTDIDYGRGAYFGTGIFSTNPSFFPRFSRWLDPFGTTAGLFEDVHAVGVFAWSTNTTGVDDHTFNVFQYPYETVPYFHPDNDLPPFGPRSAFLPVPPTQPDLPDFLEWPASLAPDEFPHEANWPPSDRRGRYLKQHIDSNSRPTAMIGINLAAADDPITNQFASTRLQQLTVAFWGPEFDPNIDLLPLDVTGVSQNSGVLLVEDGVPDPDSESIPQVYTSQNGVFGTEFGVANEFAVDTPVPLTNLRWRTQKELIDVDGDGVADDMDGDGVVGNKDKAWVLRLRPTQTWLLPARDAEGGYFPVGG